MPKLCSLTDFLHTGQLGPLHTGLDALAIAQLLGMPSSWIANDSDPFPAYWIYSGMGLSFKTDMASPPHPLNFIRLYIPSDPTDTCEVYGGKHEAVLVVTLDGLSKASRPSDVVAAMARGPTPVTVDFKFFGGGTGYETHISNGKVVVIMAADDDTGDNPGLPTLSIAGCARHSEATCSIYAIYSYGAINVSQSKTHILEIGSLDNADDPNILQVFHLICSGADYLATLAPGSATNPADAHLHATPHYPIIPADRNA